MNSIIQIPTPDLSQSLEFYEKLKFTLLSKGESNFLTDGHILLEVSNERTARSGVKFFMQDLDAIVSKLSEHTTLNRIENGFVLTDGTGTLIYLMEMEVPKVISDFSPGTSYSILGNAAGVSLESAQIEYTLRIWNILGFSITMGGLDQGWVTLKNEERLTISIMKSGSCPHLFFNPSLTYFNGKEGNPAVIRKIRELKIPITEEITAFNKDGVVDNIIIRDPGGLGFFIFND